MDYDARNALTGSTRIARRAGTKQASRLVARQDRGDSEKRQRIGRADLEEHVRNGASAAPRPSRPIARPASACSMPSRSTSDHVRRLGAERHADADLAVRSATRCAITP